MSEWKEYSFDEFVHVNPKVVFSEKGSIPFVEMKDIDASNKFCTSASFRKLGGGSRFENGDTLFARITPCLENGKIAQVRNLAGGKGLGSTEFHVLRGRKDISISDFVYYLSRWKEVRDFAEINLHGTSGRQRFPAEAFKELSLFLPGIAEQQSIAEVLSSLDDKIDLLHRQNKTLEQMAETLFRQWFVENKEETTIKNEFNVTMGQSPPGDSYNEKKEGILFYQGRTDFGFRFPDPRIYCTAPTRFAEKYDTLMSVRAPVGDLNYAEERCCIGRGLAAIRHKNQELHPSYTYFILKHLKSDFDIHEDSGTIFGSINKDELLNIKCPKFEIDKIDLYNKEIGLLDDKLVLNCKQIKKLEQLRDTLLPKLMNGTVRVTNN